MSNEFKGYAVDMPSCAGDSEYPIYAWKYDEELKTFIRYESGKMNFYEYIQASKDSTDIATILQRAANGDTTVLNVKNGVYADVTSLPNNLQDLGALGNSIKDNFNNFPDEIKALFDNSYENFFNSVISNKVDTIMSNYINSKKEKDDGKDDSRTD